MIKKYSTREEIGSSLELPLGIEESNPAYYFGDGTAELGEWLEKIKFSNCFFYAKRLSGNDTGATKSHQSGIYLPLSVTKRAFPEVYGKDKKDPDLVFTATVDSHNTPEQQLRVVYYNGKIRQENTRNESRITCWKDGRQYSPVQDPENTGALILFAFLKSDSSKNAEYLKVWVCRSPEEESYAELIMGEILPGDGVYGSPESLFGGGILFSDKKFDLELIPLSWRTIFPSGLEIIDYIVNKYPLNIECDKKLMKRREVEFGVFRAIEEIHATPLISKGFNNIDDFITVANSIANRRKSRSGKSLEIHLEKIFQEEGLHKFTSQCVTENKKRPDFIFPSCTEYHNSSYPEEKLRMLAVKTTCKDRWRQLLNEARRIHNPFLFTLQEGVSINQYAEMKHEGVTLVVPAPLHKKYPKEIQPELLTLNTFIQATKQLIN